MSTPKIKVDQFVDPERIANDVATDSSSLDALRSELSRQAGLVYFYSSMAAKAERQHSHLKLRLEAVEAQVATNVRKDAATTGEKLTADMVKERVRLHPQTIAVEQAIIEAKEVDAVLKGTVQALRDKSASLTSLTNMTRDEIRAALSVEQEAQERENRPRGHLASLRN